MADQIELSEIELTEFSRNNKNWTLAPENNVDGVDNKIGKIIINCLY